MFSAQTDLTARSPARVLDAISQPLSTARTIEHQDSYFRARK